MRHTPATYRLLASIGVPAVPLLLRDQRQRDAHRARLASPQLLETWAATHRDLSRPLAWFHAPSVGEGLQARAVMQQFRAMQPSTQIIYTHFSPSAEDFAKTVGADWSGYLGYDRVRDVERMLAAASPTSLTFTKLDLWPELAVRASNGGVSVTMIAATVSPKSGRLGTMSRAMTRAGYAALDAVGAIAENDAGRLVTLGVNPGRITITGDPRVDSVLDVVEKSAGAPPDASTLVAGSTWPEDEAVVLGAFELLRDHHPGAKLIIAPHDPTSNNLQRVSAIARELGLPEPVQFSKLTPSEQPPIIVVDRVGLLARMYGRGTMAYVGGGFGNDGIHSVFEPAAWSCPVVIGPNDRDSRDARVLRDAGALTGLGEGASPRELLEVWKSWMEHRDKTRAMGDAGRSVLERERGAAARSAEVIELVVSR